MDQYEERAIRKNIREKADPTKGMNTMDVMDEELPEGLAFQLGMNQRAMQNFSSMSVEERKRILEAGRQVAAKEEMTQLVDRIETNSFQG